MSEEPSIFPFDAPGLHYAPISAFTFLQNADGLPASSGSINGSASSFVPTAKIQLAFTGSAVVLRGILTDFAAPFTIALDDRPLRFRQPPPPRVLGVPSFYNLFTARNLDGSNHTLVLTHVGNASQVISLQSVAVTDGLLIEDANFPADPSTSTVASTSQSISSTSSSLLSASIAPTSTPDGVPSLSVGKVAEIAGGSAGATVVLLLAVFFLWRLFKRRRRKNAFNSPRSSITVSTLPGNRGRFTPAPEMSEVLRDGPTPHLTEEAWIRLSRQQGSSVSHDGTLQPMHTSAEGLLSSSRHSTPPEVSPADTQRSSFVRPKLNSHPYLFSPASGISGGSGSSSGHGHGEPCISHDPYARRKSIQRLSVRNPDIEGRRQPTRNDMAILEGSRPSQDSNAESSYTPSLHAGERERYLWDGVAVTDTPADVQQVQFASDYFGRAR